MPLLARIILWAWVVVAGILLGGGIYETVVLTPLWAGSPPESVLQWTHGIPQARFFGVVTPVYGLLSVALLALSFRMPNSMRTFALVAGASGVGVVIWTFLFFLPILQQTQATRGAGLAGEEIAGLVSQFVSWNYLRQVVLVIGWLAGLRAFSLTPRS